MRDETYEFVRQLRWQDCSAKVQLQAKLCLLDLLGVAAQGQKTKLASIITRFAVEQHAGDIPILFSEMTASATGAALAGGMAIDAIDAHDGYNPAKGHIGCGLLPALLALSHRNPNMTGEQFLTALIAGYELGARFAETQHATVEDYHTSGSWVAPTIAATVPALFDLGREQWRHAMGIAEYHGPRSQMMRCIDHPTMVKDGSGWGASTGVSAVLLAENGFTGAPSVTAKGKFWSDLGYRWAILEQYFKPYPVCRWAQPPIAAVLSLQSQHNFTAADIETIHIETFHESTRLACNTPKTTEEAQYSTSYPVALALCFGDVGPEHVGAAFLDHPEVLRLSRMITMGEHEKANALFPTTRIARISLKIRNGRSLTSDWTKASWDADTPPSASDIYEKFRKYAAPILGQKRSEQILTCVESLEDRPLTALTRLIYRPINS